jgi:GcrA cell cycle regulator
MDEEPARLPVPSSIWIRKPEVLDRLMELHAQGQTLSQIASMLNAEFGTGFTRSAISGKLHRTGVRKDTAEESERRAEARLQRRKIVEPEKPREIPDHPVEKPEPVLPPKPPATPERSIRIEAAEPVRIRRQQLPPLEGGLGLDLLQLRSSTCKWPFGELPPFTFCGYPVDSEKVYCPDHCDRAYNAARSRR